jgi:carboxypeptidase family protein
MSAQSNIDRLRVASPCPISWEQMSGDERVRFCDHCQLNVYNLSELSRNEVETLIASTEGRLCGRLYRRADGTVLTKDCPVGLRALRKRVATRVAAVFATVVSLSASVFGQQTTEKKGKSDCVPQTRITHARTANADAASISGTVVDPNEAVIPGATVLITNIATNETRDLKTSDEGTFQTDSLKTGTYSVKVEIPGFKSYVVSQVVVKDNESVNIDFVMEVEAGATVGILITDGGLIDTPPGATVISGKAIRRLPIN